MSNNNKNNTTMKRSDQSEIEQCVKTILETKNDFTNCKCEVHGHADHGNGFMSDILFANVLATKKTNALDAPAQGEFSFVLKCSKESKKLREFSPSQDAFRNEIFVYEQLIPAFSKFQLDKGIETTSIVNITPQYYGSLASESMEVIVLEDLKAKGYVLLDSNKTMNTEHMMAVLREYGRFHAVSMTLKQQQPAVYKKLLESTVDAFRNLVEKSSSVNTARENMLGVSKAFETTGDVAISEQLKKLEQEIPTFMANVLENEDPHATYSHGDCWNNNFLFKYDDEAKDKPSQVAIIDWQISRPYSPVIDAAYFIYSNAGAKQLDQFAELLQVYHKSFASMTRQLGSDPDELYPFAQLMTDWRKYARYGLIMLPTTLKVCLCSRDECPDVSRTTENNRDFGDAFLFDIKNKVSYRERIKAVVEHFRENNFLE